MRKNCKYLQEDLNSYENSSSVPNSGFVNSEIAAPFQVSSTKFLKFSNLSGYRAN